MTGSLKRRVKKFAIIILFAFALQCLPMPVFGLDFSALLQKRDQFINAVNTEVYQSLNKKSEVITKFTLGGFSFLEKRTGLNTQNKFYKKVKNDILFKTGYKIGAANGTLDFVMGAALFLAKPEKMPAKIAAIGGTFEKSLSYAVSNPRAVASILSSSFYGWLTKKEGDPLKSVFHI